MTPTEIRNAASGLQRLMTQFAMAGEIARVLTNWASIEQATTEAHNRLYALLKECETAAADLKGLEAKREQRLADISADVEARHGILSEQCRATEVKLAEASSALAARQADLAKVTGALAAARANLKAMIGDE